MDKFVESLSKAVGKISDSLDNIELNGTTKAVVWMCIFCFVSSMLMFLVSLGIEFFDKKVANYSSFALFVSTYFTVQIIAFLTGAIKLLVDRNKSGIPDVIEKELEDKKR